MNEIIHEISSKWYNFQFYNDYFECQFKKGLFKHVNEKIEYKKIKNVEHTLFTFNGFPCHQFDIHFYDRKKVTLNANFKKQLNVLENAFNWIDHMISLTNK